MDVRSILADKGRRVETVRPETSLLNAARLLKAHGIGALVVSADGAHVDGLLSEREVVLAFAEHPEMMVHRRVSEVMRREPVTARPDSAVDAVVAEMTRRRQRQVPVVDAGRLVGIISVGDLLHRQLDDATLEARVLRDVAIARL